MYALSDVKIPRDYKSRNAVALARFMALIRPWIVKSGSSLDIEEIIRDMGIPALSPRDWLALKENELDLLLAIANYFRSFSKAAWLFDGSNQLASQVGPTYGVWPSARVLSSALPMQVAIDLGSDLGPAALRIVVDDVGYDGVLDAAGPFAIIENGIDLGINRVVLRREFFEEQRGESSFPYPVELGDSLEYDGGVGTVPTVGEVITGGTSGATGTLLYYEGDAVSGTLWLTGITGTFQNNEAITGATFDALANGTVAEATIPYKVDVRGDTLDYDAGNGTPPTVGEVLTGGTSGATGVVLYHTGDGTTGTVWLGSVSGTFQNNEAIAGATFAGDVDGTLTDTSLLTAPLHVYAFNDAENALGSQYANFPRLGATKCPFDTTLLNESLSVMRWMAGGDVTDGGSGDEVPLQRPRPDAFSRFSTGLKVVAAFLEQVARGTVTNTASTDDALRASLVSFGLFAAGHHAVGVVTADVQANPERATPSIGNSLSGTLDFTKLHPVGEYQEILADLTLAHARLYGIGGGLFAEISGLGDPTEANKIRPTVHALQGRVRFATHVAAMLAQIGVDNAAEPTLFPNAVADTSLFGWPTELRGTALANLRALYKVDPTLFEKYKYQAELLASGHEPRVVFAKYTDGQFGDSGPTFTQGRVWLAPNVAVDGQTSVACKLWVNIPPLGANLGTGAFVLNAPVGVVFSAAAFQGTAPDTVASISGVGTNRLVVAFEDATGYSGLKHLMNITLATVAAGPVVGSPATGVPLGGAITGGWLPVGSSTDRYEMFKVHQTTVVTELR